MANINTKNSVVDDAETKCQFCFFWRPSWVQKLANRKFFTACYGLASITQGIFPMYFIGVMTTIENHLQIPSKALGGVLSIAEIIPIFTAIIFGYFFGGGDRPKWMCACMMCISIGSFVVTIPYFIYGYTPHFAPVNSPTTNGTQTSFGRQNAALCSVAKYDVMNKTDDCSISESQENNLVSMSIIAVGYCIQIMGSSMLYIVGTPYIDDNVDAKDSPAFIGISCAIRAIGPLFGFLLSSFILSIYINPTENHNLTPNDKDWLGAWWLGYIITGILAFICAMILAQFPRRIPSKSDKTAAQLEMSVFIEKQVKTENVPISSAIPPLKELWPSTKRVLKNGMVVARLLSAAFTWMALDGFVLFLPKLFEKRYSLTSSVASAWAGLAFLVPNVVGNVTVGFALQKLRPTARHLSVGIIAAKLIYAALLLTLVSFKCDSSHIYGSENGASFPACDAGCECSPTDYDPVCSSEGLNYFSPCHAGCRSTIYDDVTSELNSYNQCACVGNETTAFPHQCEENCPSKMFYIIVTAICNFFLSIEIIGSILLYLRCVDVKDKTYASGIASAFLGIFVFIPSKMIFSSAVDNVCTVWGNQCGEDGACLIYDVDQLAWIIHSIPAGCMMVSCLWDWMFWFKSKELNVFGTEDLHNDDNES